MLKLMLSSENMGVSVLKNVFTASLHSDQRIVIIVDLARKMTTIETYG